MNLKALVSGLTDEERRELLTILKNQVKTEQTTETIENQEVEEEEVENTEPIPFDMNARFDAFVMNKQKEMEGLSKRPVQAKNNTWQDTGEHKDVETPSIQRTPRNRPPPKKKTMTCHICTARETVNSDFVSGEFYRCSRCVGK